MNKKSILFTLIAILLVSCKSQQYRISHIAGTVVEMNSSLDARPDAKMHALVQGYKSDFDKEMNVVLGVSTEMMDFDRPESLLTNFTSDAMKAYGDEHLPGGADLSVMNVHGHRSIMPKGNVTIGNLYEIYSFDNSITFLELKGSELRKIFDAYGNLGGAGISSNVKLVLKDGKAKSATIDGKEIDDNRVYKIVTLDYLAGGNDSMDAFKNALKTEDTNITLRDIMIDFVKEQTRMGKELTSKLDGRIVVEN